MSQKPPLVKLYPRYTSSRQPTEITDEILPEYDCFVNVRLKKEKSYCEPIRVGHAVHSDWDSIRCHPEILKEFQTLIKEIKERGK